MAPATAGPKRRPSSVSVQLTELEREAGVPLLRRSGRNLELTPAGTRLADHAARTLTADEAVRAELAALTGTPRGRLKMTFVQTPALALLSSALRELAETAPHLRNRLGGYAPDIRHHTDDALILRALVASGQAVTILAALIATASPQVATRPIAEGAVHRTIFTAARASTVDAPAVRAVRQALQNAAATATAGRDDVHLLAG
jgi:DNA-binding transcriptional LysR family regulator